MQSIGSYDDEGIRNRVDRSFMRERVVERDQDVRMDEDMGHETKTGRKKCWSQE